MKKQVLHFYSISNQERGASLVEAGILIALVSLIALTGISSFSDNIGTPVCGVSAGFSSQVGEGDLFETRNYKFAYHESSPDKKICLARVGSDLDIWIPLELDF